MSELPSLLLIDDNVEFLEVLERRFRRRGFDVVACSDATAALACAAERKFDVALVDRNLRGDDGIALLKRLKLQQAEIAVLVLSGSSDGGAAQFALDAGAFEYLTKPCGLTELEAAVRRALSKRESVHIRKRLGRKRSPQGIDDRGNVNNLLRHGAGHRRQQAPGHP